MKVICNAGDIALSHTVLPDGSRVFTEEEWNKECEYKAKLYAAAKALVELKKFYNWEVGAYLTERCNYASYDELSLDTIHQGLQAAAVIIDVEGEE